MTAPDRDPDQTLPAARGDEPPARPERFPELAALEEEIRRRLRSNQRFLERFLDEEFVDDEAEEEDNGAAADDEEL
jgi:hypothetical protein